MENYNNGSWEPQARYNNITWHNFSTEEHTAFELQIWMGNTWVNYEKSTVVYNATGGSVEIEQTWNGQAWENNSRLTRTNDANMHFIGLKDEMWQNNNWQFADEWVDVLTYNASNQITERLNRRWSMTNNAMMDNEKVIYSNFKVLSAASDLAMLKVNVYPNPASDLIQVQLESTEAATAVLTDMTGRAVLSQQWPAAASRQLNLAGLANGTYLLKLETIKGTTIQKIVKQ